MGQTDRQLVERVRGGDREAFGELVDRYRDMVYGLGYHLCQDFEAAKDLAQEAFLRAYLKLGQLRDPDRFSGWLRQITANVHRNLYRRREVTTVALEEAGEMTDTRNPSEIEVVVREALSKLREPERLALTLHYINGYSHGDIGEFLGIRPETVKTRLARARQHLKTEVMAMVEDTFGKKKLSEEFTKETVQAAIKLEGNALASAVGLETAGQTVTLLIPAGTVVPCENTQLFTTAEDGQSEIEIHLLQGNEPSAAHPDIVSLGKYRLVGIPPLPRGVPELEVTFGIEAEGRFFVRARDKVTGHEVSVISKEETTG